MTEPHDQDTFERFSELLDQEDETCENQGVEEELLLGLRAVLRDRTGTPELPSDFTKTMTEAVLKRHKESPWATRFLMNTSPFLLGGAGRGKSLLSALGLGGLLALTGLLSFDALAVVGSVLLVGFVSWLLARRRQDSGLPSMPGLAENSPFPESRFHQLCFYLVPTLAILLSGTAAALMFQGLGTISYTFRGDEAGLVQLGVFFGVCVVLLLSLGWKPTLQAYRLRFGRSFPAVFTLNMFFGGWFFLATLATLGVTGRMSVDAMRQHSALWLMSLVGVLGVLSFLTTRLSCSVQANVSLGQALKRSTASLAISFLSIGFVLNMFYQMHLTKELLYPKEYKQAIDEVESWLADQMAIPDSKNGWMEVKRFMIRDDIDAGLGDGIELRLGALKDFADTDLFSKDPTTMEKNEELLKRWPQAKAQFLEELPRIREALKKPHFASIPTEATDGYDFATLVPNFILFRSISQGLALLAEEAFLSGEPEQAVDYLVLGLEWSYRANESNKTLIGLMIRIAQLSIASNPIEKVVLRGNLNDSQLESLDAALAAAQVPRMALHTAMNHEIYLVDKWIRQFEDREPRAVKEVSLEDVPAFYELLPDSYLGSERKAYLNFELSRASNWKSLGAPEVFGEDEINPFNLTSQIFVPNTARAQAQVMTIRSRVDALRLVIALERFKRKQGGYPASLQEIVPNYLQELPRDTASGLPWPRKPGFEYTSHGQTFQLTSRSQVYELVGESSRQVYGYHGDHSGE